MRRRTLRWLAAVVLTGCSGVSGLSVAVPTAPGLSQTNAEVERDMELCAKEAAGRESRERVYAACMMARGYRTTLSVPPDTYVDVFAGIARPATTITDDVAGCRRVSEQAVESAGGMGARIGAAALFGAVGGALGTYQSIVGRDAFMDCLRAKGYEVQPWKPDLSKR